MYMSMCIYIYYIYTYVISVYIYIHTSYMYIYIYTYIIYIYVGARENLQETWWFLPSNTVGSCRFALEPFSLDRFNGINADIDPLYSGIESLMLDIDIMGYNGIESQLI